jgi:hypothetical protein
MSAGDNQLCREVAQERPGWFGAGRARDYNGSCPVLSHRYLSLTMLNTAHPIVTGRTVVIPWFTVTLNNPAHVIYWSIMVSLMLLTDRMSGFVPATGWRRSKVQPGVMGPGRGTARWR